MKNSIKIIAAIIVLILMVNTSSGKTKQMTTNQFKLRYHQVDSSLIGTWEKNKTAKSKAINVYCQFNTNGTFIAFEEMKGKYIITGKGNWIVKNNQISIITGNEISSVTAFISTDKNLQFSDEVVYSKPSLSFVSK